MKNLWLITRRSLRNPLILLTAGILLIIVGLSFGYTSVHQNLPCAIYLKEESALGDQLTDFLDHYHFVKVSSEEEIIRMMQNGSADCGLVVEAGLEQHMQAGQMENIATFLVSPRTSLERSYSLITIGAIMRLYAPYFTEHAIREYGYETTFDDVLHYFDRSRAEMTDLSFKIEDVDGITVSQKPSVNLSIGLIALTGFLAYGFFAVGLVRRKAALVRSRFNRSGLWRCVVLPRLLPLGLIFCLASILGVLVGKLFLSFAAWPLILASVVYYAFLTFLFSLLLILPLSDHMLICLIALDTVLSLILLPIYRDFAAYVPVLKILRTVSVPYLLFLLL